MLNDEKMHRLPSEIFSRLTMIQEETDYENEVPGRNALLGIIGGCRQVESRLVRFLLEGSSCKERMAKSFTHRNNGPIEAEGEILPPYQGFIGRSARS